MKKRILSLLLALVMAVGMLPVVAFAAEETETASDEVLTRASVCVKIVEVMGWEYTSDMTVPFTDVSADDDAYEAIAVMYNRGIMGGYSDGTTFCPAYPLTREQVAKIFCAVLGEDGTVDTTVLPADVAEARWSAAFVCTVLNKGLMTVDSKNCFDPAGEAVESDADFELLVKYASATEDDSEEENGETEVTGYKLTFVYDDELCDFSAADWYTDEAVENGGILPINVEENRAYGQFTISNITEGYRIASVYLNDKDRSGTFIDGAYGSCAATISEDTTITVTLEKIPETLPDIASVVIYTDQIANANSAVAETVTFGDDLTGLHAEILFADKGSYPSYYAACVWQYSTDGGKTWTDLYVWGTRTDFNAAWSGFANTIKVDFMALQDYQIRVMVTPKEYYSTAGEDTCIYSAPVSVNPTTGEEDGEDEETTNPVSNLRFTMLNGSAPCLIWDISDGADSSTWYNVYASTDSGASWTSIGSIWNSSYINFYSNGTAVGTYNAFKVAATLSGEELGTCTNTDLTLAVTKETAAKPAVITLTAPTEENTQYTFTITGLTPDVWFTLGMQRTGTASGATSGSASKRCDSDGVGTVTESTSYMDYFIDDATSVCWVTEQINGVVDGNNASFTIVNHGETALSAIKGGDSGDSGDGTCAHTNLATTNVDRVEPTCTTDGSVVIVTTCKDCSAEISRVTMVLAGGCSDDNADGICDNCGGEMSSEETEPEVGETASGTCGDNLTWVLTADGVLTVSGEGTIQDCSGYSAPWYDYCSDITELVLEEGVSGIGEWAFAYCDQMTCVSLPETLATIDYGAFVLCTALTELTIPSAVTQIHAQAFTNCTKLAEITFLGDAPAFGDTMYGSNVLFGVTATVYYPADNETWTSDVMQNYGGTLTWQPCGTSGDINWKLDANGVLTLYGSGCAAVPSYPSAATVYPWSAYAEQIVSVVIEEGVTGFGAYAFDSFPNLTEVTLAGSIGSVGNYAFCNCPKLTSVTFREGYSIVSGFMFENCAALTTVVFPSTVDYIGYHPFQGTGLKTVVFRGSSVDSEVQWQSIMSDATGVTLYYPNDGTWDDDEKRAIAYDKGTWVAVSGSAVPALSPDAFDAAADTATIQAVVDAASKATAEIAQTAYSYTAVREDLLAANEVEDTTNAVVNVYVDVTVEKYAVGTSGKTLTLDITPKAQLVVNGKKTGNPAEIEVTGTVTVTIPLPADFAEEGDALQVVHTKDDGTVFTYDVTVQTDDDGGLYISFENTYGFSTFTVRRNDYSLDLWVEDNLLYYQLNLPDSELDDTGVGAEAYYMRIYDSNTKAMYSCSVWAKKDYMDPMYVTAQAGTYDTVKVFAMDADGSEGDLLAQWTLTTPITVTTGAATLPADLALKVVENESSADGVVYQLTGSTSTSVAYCVCDVDAENSGSMYMLEDDNKLCTESLNNDPVKLYSLCAETDGKQFTLDISAPMSLSVPAYEGEETESDLTRAGICVEIVEAMGWTYSEDMAVTFNDVDSTHDAYTAIAIMVSKGHIKGYATGEFDPDGDLTRAEVAKILCSVLKKDGEVDTDVLPGDIPADNWAAGYICTALNEGLMWTFEDDCFRPYDPAVGSDVDFDKLAFYAGNAWTLTFDFNTDDSELWVGTNKTYVRKGDAAKLLVRGEDFERPYYVFQGWFTEDGTLVTDETVINGDMTLYAHWEKRTTFALILYVSEILGYDENGDPYGDYVKPGTYTVAMTGPNGTTITAKEGTGEGDAPLIYSGLVAAEAENYTLTIERDGYKNYTITMAGDPYGQGSSLADMGLYMGSVIFSTAGVWQPLSGSCGDNVNWTLTDTSENQDGSAYTLTVFKVDTTLADGWMYHMDSAKEQPWAWARQEITKIVVKDGVQNVGSYAFAMCRNVTEVVLPDSVTEIAERSFVNCSGLTSLALPYVVVQIDSTAFYNCTGLTAFKMGAAPELETGETPVCWYTVKDGVLFRLVWTTSEDGTETSSPDELVCYPAVKTLTDENGDAVTVYSIPEGTRIIGESAFRSCNLTEIVIPASVSNVMPYAFDRCFDLTAITVAKDNEQYTTNDDGVLYYVVDAETANWTLVCYPAAKAGAYELPAAVTNIQDGAFGRCFNLTAITVAEGNTKYIAEDGVLFTACEQLADPENSNSEMVTVPDTLICYPVGKEGTSYTAPESMSMIGEGAFAYANVSEIILSGWVHVGDYAFEKCNGGIISITFDEEGAGFGSEAFAGTSDVICYYPAGSMVWENMMNDGNDHCYGGDNVTWKAVYDDSKAVTDLEIVKDEHNAEYYLSWTELEGEHEYRIFFRVTNEDGEQEWREFGRTNGNRWDMNDLPEDEFSAIKVETLNEYDYAVAQTILDASIKVSVLDEGGTKPESVTFIRMEEDGAEFLFAASGLKESTPYRVIFTKINENDEPDEWGVTWNTDKNGAIKVEINENCDSGLTEWFYFAIEEEIDVTYQIYEVTFAMDEDTGALTVTRSACGDAAKVVWYLDGSDELMDDAYTVTGLQFEKGNTAKYTENDTDKESALYNLSWKAPAGDEDTVIDADELEYVVYFGIAAKGEAVEGEAVEGEVTESEATEGEVTEGEVTEGEVTEGEATEGDSTEEEAVEIDWVACCEVGSDTWLNLFELAEKSYEYIAVKVVTRQNGITRAEVVSDLHTLTVVRNEVEDTETTPDVVVYRKDAEGHDYTVKITDLEKNTWYHFQLRANNEEGWNVQAGDTWFSGDDTEHTFETCGDWITEAFADANDDFHIHYSLKQLSSALTENEDEDTQHVGLTYVEVVYKYNPTYEEMPAYDDDQVKVTDVHFEIADGTPYLCWDAPVSALDGLTYHVYFEYDEQGSGWPVGEETRADLDNLSAESYHTIRIHSKLNGITVGEVKIDLTAADGMSLIVKETEDSKAKLMIDDSADDAQRFLFSGLALNGAFRFEAYTEAGGPDGPSDRCDWTADAKGMCEEHRGNWLDVDREFIDEDGNSVTVTMRKGGVYRIVEKSAALDETTGSLTITYSTTGWKNVADAIAVSTAPKTEDVTVKEDLELTEDQETEVTEAASGVTVDLVEESVEVKHEELKDEKGNAFEIPEENDETTVEEGITLEIEVQKYEVPVKDEETGDTDSDTTKLVLDITPVYTVTVTTKSETEGEKDTVQTAKAPVDTTGTPVVVTIPLPKSFVEAAGWNLYVIHTKDGGKDYTHRVNVNGSDETGYYVSFVNTEGFSTFTVTADAVGLTYTDSEGNEQSDTYSDLQSALNSARNQVRNDCTDVTVKLLVDDLEEGNLMIPAGVTLDLNGMYVKAANVLSFGSVIDTADEAGGIVITNDRSEAYVQLQTDNEYLPIYDTTYSDEIGCYRFYKYKVVNLGGIKYGTNAVMFGIRIVFEKTKAYEVLGNTTDSDVELSTALNWGKDLAYTFNADTVKKFATLAYDDLIADSSKTTTSKAIFLIVSGLSALGEGGTISSQPTVESVTGTVGIGELKQYSTAAAE